jgi:hypothetical protein
MVNDLVAAKSEENPYNHIFYTQKAKYRTKSGKPYIHKVSNIKDLKNSQKMVNILNILLL